MVLFRPLENGSTYFPMERLVICKFIIYSYITTKQSLNGLTQYQSDPGGGGNHFDFQNKHRETLSQVQYNIFILGINTGILIWDIIKWQVFIRNNVVFSHAACKLQILSESSERFELFN